MLGMVPDRSRHVRAHLGARWPNKEVPQSHGPEEAVCAGEVGI